MKEEPKKGSGIPLIIIGVVLVGAIIGGYAYYNSAKTPPKPTGNVASTNSNRANQSASAPLGATPPNLMGSTTANVTVEEFADFQCPACASVHPVMKEIQSTYGSRIRFIFRNFPLAIPQHDKAYEAAVASEAVGMQDRTKFWAMQNLLYENQQAWTANPNYRSIWEGYVQQIGLDVEKFKNDMAGRDAKARVDADLQRGRGMSIDSTPSIFVNGKNIGGFESMTVSNLRQVIDAEIQNAIKVSGGNTAAPAGNSAAPANTNAAK
ncbi:MAG: thioredoxin domain-containing protein [Acidobacteria bacterium]|nr:thioredoxin domain-containing protein [Acidobacteriota bacterium]